MSAEIRHLGDPVRHFWLTRSIARTLGISLSEAMASGELSASGYADLVTRCRKCPHPEQCELWLAAQAARPDTPPEHCTNAGEFSRLMHSQRRVALR